MTDGNAAIATNSTRMGPQGLDRLQQLEKLNSNPAWVNQDIYRLMFREDLFIAAYERIKSIPGNMTPGIDGSTLDGFSIESIRGIIAKLRDESFAFSPGRRVHIPKSNGKTRPLTIAPPRDKIVQEVMRMILNAIYDGERHPSFLESSHGFRGKRGCHTALKAISRWKNIVWFIEGDIKGCFDNIDHHILVKVLRNRISDERFLNLIWKALKAGYMEFNTPQFSLSGTPQGSIVSPILANIYLHELDLFIETLRVKYEKGEKRKFNPAYKRLVSRFEYYSKKGDRVTAAQLAKERRKLPTYDIYDQEFTRIHYVRYADDWIIGVQGPKRLAETIRDEIQQFLSVSLNLELSIEKTFIRHARTEKANFLGTLIHMQSGESAVSTYVRNGISYKARSTGWNMNLDAPIKSILERLHQKGFCDTTYKPTHLKGWIAYDDAEIIQRYNSVLWGILNYYSFARNYCNLGSIQSILQLSAAKTLAAKHRSGSIRKVFRRYGKDLNVPSSSDGNKTTSLRLNKDWQRTNKFLTGSNSTGVIETYNSRYTRSKLGMTCAVCGSSDKVVMHHVRHVRKSNSKLKGFHALLSRVNRKQVPVCFEHHWAIHNGTYDGRSLSELGSIIQHWDWV